MRLCVRWLHVCAGEEKRTLRKSALWARALTEKRTLGAGSHGKAHSAQPPELQNAHFGEAHTQNAPFREGDTPRVRLYVSRRLQSGAFVYTPASPRQSTTAQQCTQTPQNGSEGVISTDLCTLLRPHGRSHDPCESQQCTQMPQSGSEGVISTDLCTLLCRRPGGEAHIAGAMTQPPTHTNLRSLSLWVASLGARSKTSPTLSVWPTSSASAKSSPES